MTDPILRLDPARVAVEPGGQATLTLTVINPGTIVEGYSLDVVSTIPLPWVQVNPATLSVYPQQEATAVVVFAPPSGAAAPSGSLPFAVRVWSEVEGGGSAVAEGDVDIGAVEGLQTKLTPLASTGRWSGRHTLRISNWGNAPARLRLTPEDPEQGLGFLVSPEVVDVPMGGEVVARIRVRTRHPVLRGSVKRLPFQVVCEPDPPAPVAGPGVTHSTPGRPVVDGAFNQKPILTRLVVAAAGLLVLALVAGLAYLLTRGDEPSAEEQVQQPDAPTGLALSASPGVIALNWDRVAGVADYALKMTAPTDDEQPIVSSPVAADSTRMESKIEVNTEAEYCYRLIALREGAPDSAPSEQECITAVLPPDATPAPTEEASIVPIPAPEPTDEPSSPSTGEETGPSPTVAPSEDPLPFISVLQFRPVGSSADPEADLVAVRDELNALGFEAKVLFSDEFTLTPPPAVATYVLYVDGDTAEAAAGKCAAVEAAQPLQVPDGCLFPRTVTAPADPSPTP